MQSRLLELASCAAAIGVGLSPSAVAQGPTDAGVMQSASEIVAALETASCDLSLHGAPQRDELTERWLIAYSGIGPSCDATSAVLQREGLAASISFFRRPNAAEIKQLISMIRASVRRGFGCLISFNGEPRFDDESSVWTVRYYASGQQCEDATDELQRQGRELRVSFQRFR
jgi:hypothetical protein